MPAEQADRVSAEIAESFDHPLGAHPRPANGYWGDPEEE